MTTSTMPEAKRGPTIRRSSIGSFPILVAIPWMVIAAVYFLLPGYLAFGTQIMVMILFAISLDLILGYAGIVSLGHAAFFGVGAYIAGLLSIHFTPEPILGLIAAGSGAAILGLVSGMVVLRTRGLTLLMLTLCFVFMLHEIANRAVFLTGGDDGLQGMKVGPVLGHWGFDLYSRAAYVYTALVLLLSWLVAVLVVASPFGLSLIGLRENSVRMRAMGAPVFRRKVAVYTLAAAMAGIAGALSAQTTQFVGLRSISFDLSGEILIMLVLGGIGRLYGAFVGVSVYMIAQDWIAKENPVFWSFWIGIVLISVVLIGQNGLLGLGDKLLAARPRRERDAAGA